MISRRSTIVAALVLVPVLIYAVLGGCHVVRCLALAGVTDVHGHAGHCLTNAG